MDAILEKDLTWEKLVEIEPRLGQLLAEVRKVKDDKQMAGFCANNVWFGNNRHHGFKPRMYVLVGRASVHPQLRSSTAYSMAYAKLYDALPSCRNCNCSCP